MPKILQRMSQREYATYLGISNEAVSRAVRDGRIKKGWDKKNERIVVEHANKEFGFLHKEIEVEQGEEVPPAKGSDQEVSSEGEDSVTKLGKRTTFIEARRVREINEANIAAKKDRLAELELKQKTGELVRKEDVYKALFAFGQQMRIALLAIPDRSIDEILAAKTRADAHNVLTNAIHAALTDLTTEKEFEFKTRQ